MSSNNKFGIVKNYHSYICDDSVLQNIGLASYTRNSIEKFGMEKRNGQEQLSKDVDDYFGGQFTSVKTQLLGDDYRPTLSILKFDVEGRRYILSTSSPAVPDSDENIWWTPSGTFSGGLKAYQEKFDIWQKGFKVTDQEKYQLNYIWAGIQNSLSGCITFEVEYTALTCERKSLIRLYFQSAGKANSDRGVAYRTDMVFAGTPVAGHQAPFGYADTVAAGSLVPPSPGGNNNPQNTTAGQLRMVYDFITGKWESGTQQILVALLEDIDGVPQMSLPDDVDIVDRDQLFAKFGIAKTGYGMPIGVQNGNPQIFGPYSYGCGPAPKHKIRVVNRTPRVYTKGEMVICSLINGEWIPIGLGTPKTVTKKFETNWSWIQKYIVDAKSFFRDSADSKFVSSSDYVNSARAKFYYGLGGADGNPFSNPYSSDSTSSFYSGRGNDLQALSLLNLDPIEPGEEQLNNGKINFGNKALSNVPNLSNNLSLKTSNRYLTVSDGDVLSNKIGGSNTQSYVPAANIGKLTVDNEFGEVYANRTINSWGMYFKEGYTATSVRRLKSYTGGYGSYSSVIYDKGTLDFSEANSDIIHLDTSDSNLYHMPAQIALNSSSNKTIYYEPLYEAEAFKDIKNYADLLISYTRAISSGAYFPSKVGDYLTRSSDNKDLFALVPADPNSIQFTPLSLNLALSSTIIPENLGNIPNALGGYRGLYRNLNNNYIYTLDPTIKDRRQTILKPLFDRIKNLKNMEITFADAALGSITTYLPFSRYLIDENWELQRKENVIRSPDGGPDLFPTIVGSDLKERSNVVGVITAKGVITLTQGGQLELKTTNKFGIQAVSKVTLAGGDVQQVILPGVAAYSVDGRGQNFDINYVQWGSTGDEKDFTSFGTTGLHCKVYDHCENTIYDGRYFAPLHFNPDTKDMDFNIPNPIQFPVGKPITKDSPDLELISCPIRRNMLLSGGGFYYIKNFLGIDEGACIIKEPGEGYATEDVISFGGLEEAKFQVTQVGAAGEIQAVELLSRGEFTKNPLKVSPYQLIGDIKSKTGEATGSVDPTKKAKVIVESLKIMQKVMKDEEPELYYSGLLSPYDNSGKGDGRGTVESARSTTVSLPQNKSGQYDIFVYFVNDIMNYFENSDGGNTGWLPEPPPSQYINLEISAN